MKIKNKLYLVGLLLAAPFLLVFFLFIIMSGGSFQSSLQKQNGFTTAFIDSIKAYKTTDVYFTDILACYILQAEDMEDYDTLLMSKIIDHIKAGNKLSDLVNSDDLDVLSKQYKAMYEGLIEKADGNYYYACYFPISKNILSSEAPATPTATSNYSSPGVTDASTPTLIPTPTPVQVKYSYSNDFLDERSFKDINEHDGTDIIADEGTPIVAVEKGTIENIGWNAAGGWRIGIRSENENRYWYYAHMRKVHPYFKSLKKGDSIAAGQLIGYVGSTGYSDSVLSNTMPDSTTLTDPRAEDKKFIEHLHIGLEVKFEDNEEWINPYPILKFLEANKASIEKGTDEFQSVYNTLEERALK